jgi:tetratricopeptide (TPR) repeat protein
LLEQWPDNTEALFNIGQAQYQLGRYAESLKAWLQLASADPKDLALAKKVVQAYHALGQEREAEEWTERLRGLWREAHPQAPGAPEFAVVDQFTVGSSRVLTHELLSEARGDPYTTTAFVVFGEDQRPVFAVQLESSAYAREHGAAFVIGVARDKTHRTVGPAFAQRPSYRDLKHVAVTVIERELAGNVPTPAATP